ncbi:GntR family transcriptional regulator [Streptomyces sp. NPDC014733]|uniref:GntR family transcriptional regulator n=1 Tax=Streptomyces sp. NPDC014733 TaxID=3364885 RepID=UPI0036FBA824
MKPIDPLPKTPRDNRPLSVRVYERLRDLIIQEKLPPETQLVQGQVADALEVSRTPVRDALNRLTHERLVTWTPGHGHVVNEVRAQDIRYVYQVREPLEALAARQSAGRHSAVQISRLNALVEEMALIDPADCDAQFSLNRRFHMSLFEPCENFVLLQMIESLWDHPLTLRITRSYEHNADAVADAVATHRDIVHAAREGDPDRLAELMTAHWQRLTESLLRGAGS